MIQKIFCLRTFSTLFLFFWFFFQVSFSLNAQSEIWTRVSKELLNKETAQQFEDYQLFQLNNTLFLTATNRIEKEGVQKNKGQLLLPTSDKKLTNFQAVQSSVIQPELSQKYPSYQFFKVVSKENPFLQGRVSWTAKGLYAHFVEAGQSTFIESVRIDGLENIYIVYAGTEQHIERREDLICSNSLFENKPISPPNFNQKAAENTELKTFRLAITATEDFTTETEGTVEGVLSNIINNVTSLNVIYERDLAIRFLLHAKNDRLIFTDTTPSPFSDSRAAFPLWAEHTFVLDSLIGSDTYDLGHVFSAECTGGVSGIAFLAGVCSADKANAVSCVFNGNIAEFRRTLYHEVGHQLGANHTWSNCGEGTNESQRNPPTAVEPGSGSTVMSYGGVCGPFNIVSNSHDNLHGISILEIKSTLSRDTITCFETSPLENTNPTLSIPSDSFSIPILTPFELIAEASDAENTTLTYSWEQFDTGAVSEVGFPIGQAPSFRAYSPSREPVRVFPRITDIILNRMAAAEVLPDTSRILKFGVTVRDNHPNGGGVTFGQVNFFATAEAGPFLVQYPDSANIEIQRKDSMEIHWDVANTDQAPVNCANVTIYLSFNNGQDFTHLLAEGIPNNGFTKVMTPDTTTNRARIKIKCADNIFFDMSNNRFKIIDKIISSTKEDVFNQKVNLYPNPAKEIVYLNLPTVFQQPIQVSIFNALGRLVKTEEISYKNESFQFNVSEFNTGIYFLKGTIEGQNFSKRFIIQK